MGRQAIHTDPVCGMAVKPSQPVLKADYADTTYYFCAAKCRAQFMADPARYALSGPHKRKGIWQRYLDRLKKSTDGKPPSCCS